MNEWKEVECGPFGVTTEIRHWERGGWEFVSHSWWGTRCSLLFKRELEANPIQAYMEGITPRAYGVSPDMTQPVRRNEDLAKVQP